MKSTLNGGKASVEAPYEHIPVLYEAVLEALRPHTGGSYIDATVGLGGHAAGILERSSPAGRLLGLDLDSQALEIARERLAPFGGRAILVHGGYDELGRWAQEVGWKEVQGVLFDLGLSSLQMDRAERGFSFQADAPLDMRFDRSGPGPTAADLVNELDEAELADLLWRYGEERASRRIARYIVESRRRKPIERTGELAHLVEKAVGRRGKIHPATQTFMALRIAVNQELDRLPRGLAQAVELLAPGGRLVVIAFHSLEDRLVKRFIQAEEGKCTWPGRVPPEGCPELRPGQPLPRACQALPGAGCAHPARLKAVGKVQPDREEALYNPRARSARLRVAERIITQDQGTT